MKRINRNFWIFIFLFIVSCDRTNTVEYIITNQSSDSLKVKYTFTDNFFDTHPKDTTIQIKGGRQKTLFICKVISPRVYNPEDNDKMQYVQNLDIMRLLDNVYIKKDVSLRKYWEYHKINKGSATNILKISQNDF
jgi:hypothetical protein